jgi:hypothetical protein
MSRVGIWGDGDLLRGVRIVEHKHRMGAAAHRRFPAARLQSISGSMQAPGKLAGYNDLKRRLAAFATIEFQLVINVHA